MCGCDYVYTEQSNKVLNVTVLSDPPAGGTLCVDETVILTCQVSDVTHPSYKWSSTKFNISEQTSSINVTATTISIEYYCIVFDVATNRSGEGSIVVTSSGKLILFKATIC